MTQVRENALDKVLRLAGGVTQGYVHIVKGRPVTVSPYRTPHPAQAPLAGPSVKSTSWGSIKAGQTVVIRSIPYRVMKVNVQAQKPPTGKASQGKGVPQSKGVNTGRQGSGLNTASNFAVSKAATAAKQAQNAKLFGTSAQNPQSALMSGASGTGQHATALLQQAKTGKYYYVSVPVGTMVNVLG